MSPSLEETETTIIKSPRRRPALSLSGVVSVTACMGCIASLCVAAWPLSQPLDSKLEPVGVRPVRSTEASQIDAVLLRRGPGLGLRLREQVAMAIDEESREAGFDPMLIIAIIDVESDFVENAVSEMGARGLMQIQPITLQFIAEREKLKLPPKELEADPALRVRLGIRYVRFLMSRFGNDLNLALMAYNAGPTRVYTAYLKGELEQFQPYVVAVRREYASLKREHQQNTDWALALTETLPRPEVQTP
jgi:soluble lytic murein transglycosylase-like protein